MNAASKFYREFMAFQLAKAVVPWASKHVEPAFNGDVDAAFSLSIALPDADRGAVAVGMWRAKVPREAFRAYFSCVWMHDHRHVIEAAQTRRRLAYLFRYAAFPLPDALPDVVRVWRGTSKLSIAESSKGYSWTTNRDIACWFAMRFADSNGSPLVLAADVPKTDIALFTDDRSESEAVLMMPPKAIFIDGSTEDWAHGYQRFEACKKMPIQVGGGSHDL